MIWAEKKKVVKNTAKVTFWEAGQDFMSQGHKTSRYFESLEKAFAWAKKDLKNPCHAHRQVFKNNKLMYEQKWGEKELVEIDYNLDEFEENYRE